MISKRGETAPEGSTKGTKGTKPSMLAPTSMLLGKTADRPPKRRRAELGRAPARYDDGCPGPPPAHRRADRPAAFRRARPRASRGATLRAEEAPPPLAEALAAVEAAQLVHVAAEVIPDAPRYYMT